MKRDALTFMVLCFVIAFLVFKLVQHAPTALAHDREKWLEIEARKNHARNH